ncbi:hypothetical protein AAFX91_30145 [Bradyrhizobium sp. 31Argb]|uniref:hypothetical protein n=1 Tax=unclassified Bradyrhizobium TaxID=2631580 RepID=UPI00102ECC1E|nr:hypothetical protein [Bradyrhizobium sp. Leo170]TAI61094.1 hypothetical protein CWO89_37005 [Bradyrhizobium sp. Leo170]
MNLANEVSTLQTEIESLRSENETLKHNKAILDFENEGLRRQLARANADRDAMMRRGEAIKSLLDQTGAALMHGLQKFHDTERELDERRSVDGSEVQFLPRNGGNGQAASTEH